MNVITGNYWAIKKPFWTVNRYCNACGMQMGDNEFILHFIFIFDRKRRITLYFNRKSFGFPVLQLWYRYYSWIQSERKVIRNWNFAHTKMPGDKLWTCFYYVVTLLSGNMIHSISTTFVWNHEQDLFSRNHITPKTRQFATSRAFGGYQFAVVLQRNAKLYLSFVWLLIIRFVNFSLLSLSFTTPVVCHAKKKPFICSNKLAGVIQNDEVIIVVGLKWIKRWVAFGRCLVTNICTRIQNVI